MDKQPDPTQPTEFSLVKQTFYAIWENGPLLAILSLLLGVVSVPSISLILAEVPLYAIVPLVGLVLPVWAALQAIQARMLEGKVARFGAFVRSIPLYWSRAALFGLLLAVPIVLGLFTVPLLNLEEVPTFVWAALFADGFCALALVAISLYFFPLLGLHNLAFRTALLDAAILATRLPFHTMGLIGMAVLFVYAIRWQPALGFFLPTVWAMFAVNNCRYVLSREGKGRS